MKRLLLLAAVALGARRAARHARGRPGHRRRHDRARRHLRRGPEPHRHPLCRQRGARRSRSRPNRSSSRSTSRRAPTTSRSSSALDQPCTDEPDIQADLEVAAGDDVTAAAVGPRSARARPSWCGRTTASASPPTRRGSPFATALTPTGRLTWSPRSMAPRRRWCPTSAKRSRPPSKCLPAPSPPTPRSSPSSPRWSWVTSDRSRAVRQYVVYVDRRRRRRDRDLRRRDRRGDLPRADHHDDGGAHHHGDRCGHRDTAVHRLIDPL